MHMQTVLTHLHTHISGIQCEGASWLENRGNEQMFLLAYFILWFYLYWCERSTSLLWIWAPQDVASLVWSLLVEIRNGLSLLVESRNGLSVGVGDTFATYANNVNITDTDRWAQNGGIKVIFSQLSKVVFYLLNRMRNQEKNCCTFVLFFVFFIHTDRICNASSVQFTFNG